MGPELSHDGRSSRPGGFEEKIAVSDVCSWAVKTSYRWPLHAAASTTRVGSCYISYSYTSKAVICQRQMAGALFGLGG